MCVKTIAISIFRSFFLPVPRDTSFGFGFDSCSAGVVVFFVVAFGCCLWLMCLVSFRFVSFHFMCLCFVLCVLCGVGVGVGVSVCLFVCLFILGR